MDKNTIQELKLTFDDIIHSTKDGVEYWNARELCKILGYITNLINLYLLSKSDDGL